MQRSTDPVCCEDCGLSRKDVVQSLKAVTTLLAGSLSCECALSLRRPPLQQLPGKSKRCGNDSLISLTSSGSRPADESVPTTERLARLWEFVDVKYPLPLTRCRRAREIRRLLGEFAQFSASLLSRLCRFGACCSAR